MSTTADAVNGDRPREVTLELPLVVNARWCAVDLDELQEATEGAGLPGELILTYLDAGNRRRYVERCPERKQRNGRKAATA